MPYRLQPEKFCPQQEIDLLRHQSKLTGAVVNFIGYVRDFFQEPNAALVLECYHDMALTELAKIGNEAQQRWDLIDCLIIHRYGFLRIGEPIVLIASLSQHRADAFASCEFMTDMLKVRIPIWKKEQSNNNENWISTKETDLISAQKWLASKTNF